MNNNRRTEAWNKRQAANQMAHDRPHPKHYSNGDEQKFRHDDKTEGLHNCTKENIEVNKKSNYLVSYTKGLPHNHDTGLVNNPDHFQYFVKAIDSGDPRDFRDTPLGFSDNIGEPHSCIVPEVKNEKGQLEPGWKSEKAKKANDGNGAKIRAWESQSAGLAFELEGPDAQAVTMPPAPKLGSSELTAEMAEVYCQAILRDIPFKTFSAGGTDKDKKKHLSIDNTDFKEIDKCTKSLNQLDWFKNNACCDLNDVEKSRKRSLQTPMNAFRGITIGDKIGPYLSQFLLVGNSGINGEDNCRSPKEGFISYGAIRADQRVRQATPFVDYMTTWEEWLDVQNGADLRNLEALEPNCKYRFIHTPRDLATYVHYDALYEAYLNACLILLGNGTSFDPGIPFQESDNRDHQQGFAHFGGPHILSLVTEVATRALKAVRFQKYNIHRRCRPEVLAARIHKSELFAHSAPELLDMHKELDTSGILNKVEAKNGLGNTLLPMAFCEGSPMHPSYGAGHATVAGACVTILKAFFDHGQKLCIVPDHEIVKPSKKDKYDASNFAYVSINDGNELAVVPVYDQDCKLAHLTVEGELNKLASNISIGRNWAGVHYFTDYYESLLMGEQIAIGILEEQKLMFGENFSMTVPLFNGDSIRI